MLHSMTEAVLPAYFHLVKDVKKTKRFCLDERSPLTTGNANCY